MGLCCSVNYSCSTYTYIPTACKSPTNTIIADSFEKKPFCAGTLSHQLSSIIMESMKLKYSGNPDDHQERSITFSSLNLNNSSIEFYSEDDEEETSYIEIALDEPLALSMIPQLCNQQLGEGEKVKAKSKEMSTTTDDYPDNRELGCRMSSSPLVSTIPGFPASTSPALSSSSNTTNSTSSSECNPAAADGYAIKSRGSPPKGNSKFSPMPIIGSTGNNKRTKQFQALHRLLNLLLSAFKQPSSSLENTEENGCPDGFGDDKRTALMATGSWEVVRDRKTSEPLTTALNNGGGGGVKLVIKFKPISIRSVVASFFKPQKEVISPGGNNTIQQNKRGPNKQRLNKSNRMRLMKPFDKWTAVKPTKQQEDQSDFSRSINKDKYSLDLDAIKKILDSLSVMKIGRSKGKQISKSCSNPIKSSPIHGGEVLVPRELARKNYTRDNSVQAAIAHCKRSFGQMNHG